MDTQKSVATEDRLVGDLQRRQQLGKIAEQVLKVANTLEMSDEQNILQELKTLIESETFKVLVLGEFNTGKSTFINALLGQEILPSYVTPATAIINEIKWGGEPAACLHFNEPEKVPVNISVDTLEEYVVIKDGPDQIRESPYSHLELFWPIELCRNRVELIDSPGLNESKVREQVTLNYLRKVDAVVFVMMATKLGPTLREQETLKLLNESGHKELFFIVNQYDLLRRERDQQAVQQRAFEQLSQYNTERPKEEAIHFISSLDALDGRIESNSTLLDGSGILPLEHVLTDFLFNERSRIKSKRTALELQLSISRAQKVIPDKRTYLQTPLAELRQRYSSAQSQFNQLNADKNRIIRRLERFRRDISELVESKIRDFFYNLETEIDTWVSEYNAQLKFNLNVTKQVEELLEDIVKVLDAKVEEEFREWSESILMPFVENQTKVLKQDLERMAEDFEADLRRTRLELMGISISQEDLDATGTGPKNALERILAAAGGFFLMGLSGAGLGAIFGWREVLDALLPQMIVAFAVGTFGLLPFLPIIMLVAGSIQGGLSVGKIIRKLKDEVIKVYKQKLREGVPNQSNKITQQIDLELNKLSEQLEQGLELRIAEVEEQVKTALRKQEEGQHAVDIKLTEIDQTERDLSDISVELVEFIALIDQT